MSRPNPSSKNHGRAASAQVTTADAGAASVPRSILVIKPRAIGDVLLSTIVLPNLRAAYPLSLIHI